MRRVEAPSPSIERVELLDDELGAMRGQLALVAYLASMGATACAAVSLVVSPFWWIPSVSVTVLGALAAQSYFCSQHVEIDRGVPWLVTRFGMFVDRDLLAGRRLGTREDLPTTPFVLDDGAGGSLLLPRDAGRIVDLAIVSADGYRGTSARARPRRSVGAYVARALLAWARAVAR